MATYRELEPTPHERDMFMRMAVNDDNELNSLLAYYRDRINSFDRERQEWLQRLEDLKISQSEKHKLEWELSKRKNEINEIRATLNESKVALFEERQNMLRLRRENDQLKIKEREDRKKIAELLLLTDSVEQDIVLSRDVRPEVFNKYVQNDFNIHKNVENFEKAAKSICEKGSGKFQKISHAVTIGAGKPKHIIKTIYLPHEQSNSLAADNESLRRQLDEERENFVKQIEMLKEELRVKDSETRMGLESDQAKISTLQSAIDKLEKENLSITKDYFALRMKANENERKLQEENELLRLRNTAIANKLTILTKQSEIENKVSKDLIEKRSEEYASKYRHQVKQKEENIQIIKDQYAKVQQIYIERVKELESSLTKLAEKYQTLERKRKYEIQGFRTQLNGMTQRLYEIEGKKSVCSSVLKEEDPNTSHTLRKSKKNLKKAEKSGESVRATNSSQKRTSKKGRPPSRDDPSSRKKERDQNYDQHEEEAEGMNDERGELFGDDVGEMHESGQHEENGQVQNNDESDLEIWEEVQEKLKKLEKHIDDSRRLK